MSKFISISGPSTTGKTSLINSLSTHQEMSKVIFSPDMHDVVWNDLVSKRMFHEFTEILYDNEYLCTYLVRLIDYYNAYIDSYKDSDSLVILDGCWVDLAIYANLNMWYNRTYKPLQGEIFSRLAKYNEDICRVYITKTDDASYPVAKDRLRGGMTTFRQNRPLEIQYYDLAKHLKNSVALPSSDVSDCSLFIIDDLKNLGHL